MAWKCSKCGVEMEEVSDIKLSYHGTELPDGRGLRCPQCKVEFLDGEYVTEELNPSEQMLEGK